MPNFIKIVNTQRIKNLRSVVLTTCPELGKVESKLKIHKKTLFRFLKDRLVKDNVKDSCFWASCIACILKRVAAFPILLFMTYSLESNEMDWLLSPDLYH